MNEKIRICLVDDHLMLLDGLSSILKMRHNFEVAGVFSDPLEFLDQATQINFDLLITDFSMPGLNGLELIMELKNIRPDVKTLLLSMHYSHSTVSEALMAEAEGYIIKNTGKEELYRAIEKLAAGGIYYGEEVIKVLMEREKEKGERTQVSHFTESLTGREKEVLCLIMNENTSDEIADQLCISKRTVDTHRQHLLEKTKTKTVVGLMKYAIRKGLVEV